MHADQLPGPPGLPLVGNLRSVARDVLGFLTHNAEQYGDRARWTIPGEDVVQLAHPDDIEQVLVRERTTLEKDPITRSLDFVLGNGLLTAEGDAWKRHRKLAAPSFSPAQLEGYGRDMVQSALEDLPGPGRLDVHQWMSRVTLHIVLRTLFGSEPGGVADAVGPLTADLLVGFDTEFHGPARLLPEWIPLPHRRRMNRSAADLDRLLRTLVRERRARAPGDDLLSRLIEARAEGEAALGDTEVRDDAITLFLAGHETTALALSYTLWLIGRDAPLQDEIVRELDQVLGDRAPTAADVRRLPLATAAIDEAMRLYPPAWTVGRRTLETVRLDGLEIPAGRHVLLPQWVVHRDPRWWREPLAYRPRRWLDGETQELPRFAYFPFGGGARVCIGNHFARMEAVLVLATLLRERRFVALPGWEPTLMPSVTLRPLTGVPMDVERRARVPRVAAA